ncbi:MAG TPA: putative metallopeptidase [Candidatus Limnocylindrales bacterium]|nr:putative metallopeptidase [Candidatus Limnocylindrales bacterium]
MPRPRRKQPRTSSGKTVSYEFIPRDSPRGEPMYRLLDALVREHHHEIRFARIALAWCTSWKPDVDGKVTIGKCKKASDLDREFMAFDFVILLSKAYWTDPLIEDRHRAALLDHELCHAAITLDRDGEPVVDERGRPVYRLRKHDIEEFHVVPERHGLYKHDLERMAQALRRAAMVGFSPCESCAGTPGWVPDPTRTDGAVKRCACWKAWQARITGTPLDELEPTARQAAAEERPHAH